MMAIMMEWRGEGIDEREGVSTYLSPHPSLYIFGSWNALFVTFLGYPGRTIHQTLRGTFSPPKKIQK
jgi:hypothetical protein